MPEHFLSLSDNDRRYAIDQAAEGLGHFVDILEKDVQVVWSIQTIFESAFGEHLVFKDGTSLGHRYQRLTISSSVSRKMSISSTAFVRSLLIWWVTTMKPCRRTAAKRSVGRKKSATVWPNGSKAKQSPICRISSRSKVCLRKCTLQDRALADSVVKHNAMLFRKSSRRQIHRLWRSHQRKVATGPNR